MDTSWFELRVNYEKVAAFSYGPSGQTSVEAYEKAFALLEVTRADLYKDKMMQVVDVWEGKGKVNEQVVHDECPDALKPEIPNHTNSTPFDLMVL
jgi:hypothetical protein